jgi:hypothetical protein
MRALVVLALAFCACKDKQPAPPATSAPAPAEHARDAQSAPHAAPPVMPSVPDASGSAAPAPQPITAEDATAAMPKLTGDVMIAAKATADGHQVHGTWCLPGTAADAVVHDLAATLTSAGWADVTTRGDATKAGVSAERDGYRLSYVVSASSAATCRAPGHYLASATMFRLR